MSEIYQTQWAAQFYVAYELVKRGYLVSFTLGNAPKRDILAVSPSGDSFHIDVKGAKKYEWFVMSNVRKDRDLYYILCKISKNIDDPPFCGILTSEEAFEETMQARKQININRKKRNLPPRADFGTYNISTATIKAKYLNQWEKLPK